MTTIITINGTKLLDHWSAQPSNFCYQSSKRKFNEHGHQFDIALIKTWNKVDLIGLYFPAVSDCTKFLTISDQTLTNDTILCHLLESRQK